MSAEGNKAVVLRMIKEGWNDLGMMSQFGMLHEPGGAQ